MVSAEDYLREKYGAYRGHHAWRDLEEAFNAGKSSATNRIVTDEEVKAWVEKHGLDRGISSVVQAKSAFDDARLGVQTA